MKYKIDTEGSFPLVYVDLNRDEEIQMERGAMVYHNGKIDLQGKMNSGGSKGIGGIIKAVGRSMVSGESMFISTARGLEDGAMVALAPSNIGRVKEIEVGNTQWRLNDGAFVASDSGVNYKMVRQSVGKAIFAGTGGLFVMETNGEGTMLVSGNGDLIEIELDGSTNYQIDNFHVVAWEASLSYNIKVASGMFGFKSGEGLVNEFNGSGKVIIQTRNIQSFAQRISPFISKG